MTTTTNDTSGALLPHFRRLRAVPDVPLLWPLISATLVLGVLSLFGLVEQQKLERQALDLALAPVEQTERTIAAHMDRELRVTEHSLQRYRDTLAQGLQAITDTDISPYQQRFEQAAERTTDGAQRSRKSTFNSLRDASVFVPNYATINELTEARYARAKEVTEIFGRGAEDRALVDTWWMAPSGAIILHGPTMAAFYAYDIAADHDYRETEWYRLTLPELNPQGLPRWTALSYDEPSAVWMLSVVMPLHVKGEYQGSVGHDILLHRVLQDTASLRPVEGAGFVLLDPNDQLIASDEFSAQLTDPSKSRDLSQLAAPAWQNAVRTVRAEMLQTGRGQVRTFLDDHLVVATVIGSQPWLLINRVPLQPYSAPVHAAFSRLRAIALGVLIAEVLLTLLVLWWNRRRVHAYHRETAALHRELQEVSYTISHQLHEPVSQLSNYAALLRQSNQSGGADNHSLLDQIEQHSTKMLSLTDTLQAYLRIGEQLPATDLVPLTDVLTDVRARLPAGLQDRIDWHMADLPSVRGDRALLTELFYQLLLQMCIRLNQMEQPRLDIGARGNSELWDICLLDNGLHPDPSLLAAFSTESNANHATTPVIGLAIVRRIAEYHGGHCWAEPGQTGGTESGLLLHVQLPRTA